MPEAVAFPTINEKVAAIGRFCHVRDLPIVPFGADISLEGHVAAVRGGVSISIALMDGVLAVSPEALDCQVQGRGGKRPADPCPASAPRIGAAV